MLKATGQLNEATLLGFARQRRYEETVAALAALSGSTVEVIRPLMQSLRDDGLLVPCKAAQLSWETTSRRARKPLCHRRDEAGGYCEGAKQLRADDAGECAADAAVLAGAGVVGASD